MESIKTLNIENYRELFTQSPLGIFIATINGQYIEVNSTLAKILGYRNSKELLNISDISSEVYFEKEERENIVKNLFSEKKILLHETEFKSKTGSPVPVCVSYNLVSGTKNENLVVGLVEDISERKLAEHAIRESEEHFRQLAENTSDAFILWDNEGILYANPAFEKIFGISIEEVMQDIKIIENMIDKKDRQRYIRNRRKETTGKQKSRNQQYILKKKQAYIKRDMGKALPCL